MSIDYPRAMAAYEVGVEGGNAVAVGQLGLMYGHGLGVTPSWRHARELFKRATELGNSRAVEFMQTGTESIAAVHVTRSGRPPYTSPIQFA